MENLKQFCKDLTDKKYEGSDQMSTISDTTRRYLQTHDSWAVYIFVGRTSVWRKYHTLFSPEELKRIKIININSATSYEQATNIPTLLLYDNSAIEMLLSNFIVNDKYIQYINNKYM